MRTRAVAPLLFVLLFNITTFGISAAEAPVPSRIEFKSPTLGTVLTGTIYTPEDLDDEKAVAVAIYAYNGRWPTPGIPSPEAMRSQLSNEGFIVIMLDYGGHEKATMPELWRDGEALTSKKMFRAIAKAISAKVSEVIVVPEGYTAKKKVHIYDSPDNQQAFYGMIVYPINPPQPVPLLIRQNNAGSWSSSVMAGTEFRGYARAWAGHPFNYDKGQGIFPNGGDLLDTDIAYGKSAIRSFRHHAEEFNIDPNRFGVYGSSKHGNQSVWLGLTGDVPELDKQPAGLHKNESSQVQFVAAAATWGFSEHLVEDEAPKDVPEWMGWNGEDSPPPEWLKKRSWSTYVSPNDPPMALDRCHGGHWRTEQVKRLIRAVDDAGIRMTQSLTPDLPNYKKNRTDWWLDFADSVLKPTLPIVKDAN